jgi:hypothetical protein
MKGAAVLILVLISGLCSAQASKRANDPSKVPDNGWFWYSTCDAPYNEARGTIDAKEVCVLTSKCHSAAINRIVANVKAYCPPNDSNRCPSSFEPCFTDRTFTKSQVEKIKYKDMSGICFEASKGTESIMNRLDAKESAGGTR